MPTAEWRAKNPERQKEISRAANARRWAKIKDDPAVKEANNAKTRAWYAKNRERALETKKRNNAAPAAKARRLNNALLNNYGITSEQRDAIFAAQNFRCAICDSDSPSRRWDTDHCHATGLVRGILCSSCNLMLGHARDNKEVLLKAIQYLQAGSVENVARIIKR